ncbi:hypothetical protein GCM10011352_21540 [Marinobacterium zhoushanense]|uniref:Metal-dependent HD superfamily phosphohydrolase n=1 Tax=Marinobacterium zhoushanense TaxID=1679163 RepID=A0ABQ1KE28_9GAMM|nr:hypothetical protein [Marinobacterium zhoushanense]GGB95138.1 hypothetical protein GCM10011352_21540 [Marinobacterium zhoushanense]
MKMSAERFEKLWARNVAPDGNAWSAAEAYAYLEKQYSQPSRSYHDQTHIDQCLGWLDRYAETVDDPDAVELAIWFHDACYLPSPQGHEERSARLFNLMVADGMSSAGKEKIIKMIGYTTHSGAPQTSEEALLVDIDLASFCRPWHQFLIDTVKCRCEKKDIDDLEFCERQICFLNGLAARPHIYFSPPFRKYHEAEARENIARILELLEQRKERLAAMRLEAQQSKPGRHGSGL